MKNKASMTLMKLKHIISLLSSFAKAKSMAIKSKTSAAKARLLMFSLIKNKKVLMDSVSHKIHSILGRQDEEQDHAPEDQSKAIVLYSNAMTNDTSVVHEKMGNVDGDDKYPDLRHSLFDEEEEEQLMALDDQGGGCGSIIDMVRNSKEEEGGKFNLEDEIDHVADLFINRFHKQIRLQKLLSFKRFQEMLERST